LPNRPACTYPGRSLSSFVEDAFDSVFVSLSSSSEDRNDLSDPNTEARFPRCKVLGRSFGLSDTPTLSKLAASEWGIEGLEGVEREAKMDKGLLPFFRRVLLPLWPPPPAVEDSSLDPVERVESVGRKILRLFRRRGSDILRRIPQ
jgi:hypothetical protein